MLWHGEPHSLKVTLSQLSSLRLLKRLKDASAFQYFLVPKGPGKPRGSDNSGTKLGFPKLWRKQGWQWSQLGIFEIVFIEEKQAEILGTRLGSEVEGKCVALSLMGSLEPSRHSSPVYGNEFITVLLYSIFQGRRVIFLG